MRQRVVLTAALLMVLGFAGTASAQAQYCFNPSGFGNVFRITVVPMGAPLLLTGVENVFADRVVTGTAQVGVRSPGTYRLGFTYVAMTTGGTNSVWNVSLNASTLTGTFDAWNDASATRLSGAISLVSCAGVPDEQMRELPDIGEALAGRQ